jgi:hypothetical protein
MRRCGRARPVRVVATLGLRDRVQAVVYGHEHQLVRPGDPPQ